MFRICSQCVIVSVLVLGGCSKPVPISDADRTKVEAFIAREQQPLPVKHLAMWYSEGDPPEMVCGEIEAPPALRDRRSRLRYVYLLKTPRPEGTIEMHELVTGGGSVGEQLIRESRRTFDRAWELGCVPTAPSSIGRWFRGTETAGDGSADTPMTNAHINDLLEKQR